MAALTALVIYGLACSYYPVAWSPDSDRLVFPVFKEGPPGVLRLVMTDLSGNMIREIAHADGENAFLSPAAWSPDGKSIAYIRFEAKAPDPVQQSPDLDEARALDCSLIVQDANSGEEECIFIGQIPISEEGLYEVIAMYGPQWGSDSKTLATKSMSEGSPCLVVVDTEGNLQKQMKLGGKVSLQTASISPTGRHVSYLEEMVAGEHRRLAVCLFDFGTGTTRQIAFAEVDRDEVLTCRPAWSPESDRVYFAPLRKGENVGVVKRYTIKTQDTTTVWSKADVHVVGISVALKTGRLAVDYLTRGGSVGIEVLDLESGDVTPIHFGGLHYSTAISPDGKWVAFCPGMEDAEDKPGVGAIVSSDGSQLRFFLPEPEAAALVPEIVATRLEGAWEHSGFEDELQERDAKLGRKHDEMTLAEVIGRVDEFLDKILEEQAHPIFKEAAEYTALTSFMEEAQPASREERMALIRFLQKRMNRFLENYPGHLLGPELKERLGVLIEEAETEAEAPPEAALEAPPEAAE